MKTLITAALILISFFSCARPPAVVTRPEDALAPARIRAALRDDMELREIALSARQSLAYYEKIPAETEFVLGPDRATALDMAVTLRNFLLIVENESITPDQKAERIKNDFLLYRAAGSDGKGRVLFTGYYEPTIPCRAAPDGTFRHPLYRRPGDIIEVDLTRFGNGYPKNKIVGRLAGKKVVPYYSRKEIDHRKTLAGKSLELLWCADLVDIFMLQVQGSGKVDLGDGNIMSVLYDGGNGRPYKSIGRHLIETGAMTKENMSMQGIREYLRANPDRLVEVLNHNESYVFFRLETGPSRGSIGVALTPGRSIATDSRLFPKGALGFISAQKPVIVDGEITGWAPFSRFVLNQDTGGAIKGAGRADVFFGQGPEAELTAGNLQHEGELYFLVRKKGEAGSR
jgi:membrane-bound lytic murein transglycosylase A